MNGEFDDAIRIRLRALAWSSDLLRTLAHSDDMGAVAIAANLGLDATYDLLEIFTKSEKVLNGKKGKTEAVDKWLVQLGGQEVGALALVRGLKTHEAFVAPGQNRMSSLPYDFAHVTQWCWAAHPPVAETLRARADWYQRQVADRPLWVPIDRALNWFIGRSEELGLREPPNSPSVLGVSPIYPSLTPLDETP